MMRVLMVLLLGSYGLLAQGKQAVTGAYMGQDEPGSAPRVFAPGFISQEAYEFGSVFNASGTEFYYGVNVDGQSRIRYTERVGGEWTEPKTILSHPRYGYNDPFLSPDETRLYFISQRSLADPAVAKGDHDIWYVQRTASGEWSEPINAGPNINSAGEEYYISFTRDGTMYFSSSTAAADGRGRASMDIHYARWVDGAFAEPVPLGDSVNTGGYEADVFVDPDGDYLIFCSIRPEGLGRGDLYISFRKPGGGWTEAKNMGDTINSPDHELCPFVTADGKYLFYTSKEDIYWVGTEVIERLRKGR